ncbi:MAG: methyltransferase domain-containing protein [Bacillaceae bacterium]|nr:methyltransferase domain-containing protein [Bacillaceae bacterium]
MKVKGILPFARQLLRDAITRGDACIDGTIGNGHDTLYLAQLVGEQGHVFGFDIQEIAIEKTKKRLEDNHSANHVTLFPQGHEKASSLIDARFHGKIAGAIFNLGYLPGGDKSIVTKPETTLEAISSILSMLKKEGIIVLVIYHGHEEGKKEKEALMGYLASIDQTEAHVLTYQFINQQNNPPFIVAIEKR